MSYERRHENLPFGPLTRRNFVMLAGSFYDGGGPTGSLLEVVKQRGVDKGDLLRLEFAEVLLRGAAASTDNEADRPDLGGAGVGQTGIELPE